MYLCKVDYMMAYIFMYAAETLNYNIPASYKVAIIVEH